MSRIWRIVAFLGFLAIEVYDGGGDDDDDDYDYYVFQDSQVFWFFRVLGFLFSFEGFWVWVYPPPPTRPPPPAVWGLGVSFEVEGSGLALGFRA